MSLDDLLGQVAQFTDDVIVITEAEPLDPPGPRIVYVNPAFTRMTGYTSDDVRNRPSWSMRSALPRRAAPARSAA